MSPETPEVSPDTPQVAPAPDPPLTEVESLRQRLRMMEQERYRHSRSRLRRILGLAIAVSLLAHICIMIYLALQYRAGLPGSGDGPAAIEFAVVTDEQLTELESIELSDLTADDLADIEESPLDDAANLDLEAVNPAADLAIGDVGALPTLGGAGEGESGSGALAGGGAGATFFGISSTGNRFAYIVDRSGSMGGSTTGGLSRMAIAKRELLRSLTALPDYAHFYAIFFSDKLKPDQRHWYPARIDMLARFENRLADVGAAGGTYARPAFEEVFNLEIRPDVIFFLTDGQQINITPEEVRELNRRGRRIIINTIAFGVPEGQDHLKRIAAESGGVYRFVSAGGP